MEIVSAFPDRRCESCKQCILSVKDDPASNAVIVRCKTQENCRMAKRSRSRDETGSS